MHLNQDKLDGIQQDIVAMETDLEDTKRRKSEAMRELQNLKQHVKGWDLFIIIGLYLYTCTFKSVCFIFTRIYQLSQCCVPSLACICQIVVSVAVVQTMLDVLMYLIVFNYAFQ